MDNFIVSFLVNGVVETADVPADRTEVSDGVLYFIQKYDNLGREVVNYALPLTVLLNFQLKA